MFFSPFPNCFALSISDRSIKVIQLKNFSLRRGKPAFHILALRSTSIPDGLIKNGLIEAPEQIRKYITHLLSGGQKQKPIKGEWVVASIPDSQGFIKLIHIDKKEDDIIDDDIIISAKKHIPFGEDEYYIDWQIMPEHTVGKDTTDVLIGAVPKNVADQYTYLLESLGLGVVALEIEALATARAMITAQKTYENEARLILDLGRTRSTLILYDHDHIQFSRLLSFSGDVITKNLVEQLKISEVEAIKAEHELGLSANDTPIWPVILKQVENLSLEIEKAINFYESHFPNPNKVTHITMCGGLAALKNLDTVLSLKLKVPAQPGRVWKNLFLPKEPMTEEAELGFASTVGLALRAADNPFFMRYVI